MGRKSKVEASVKVEIVEEILRGSISKTQAAKEIGVSKHAISSWIAIYESDGPSGLMEQSRNAFYSEETKLNAVLDYLNGQGSQQKIAQKYHLRSRKQLQDWVNAYNTHGEIKNRGSGGGSYMSKARNTTYEERLEIVKECIANDHNYGAAAKKYECSYQQVRNWVKRYEELGEKGLEDRRGKRAGTLPARTKEEEMRDRIAQLERINKQQQMEIDLLKKVRELENKDRFR